MRRRAGLSQMMALIVVLAAGLAAMKVPSDATARASSSLFLVALLIGTLGLMTRRDRGAWLGFTLFGCVYALIALVPPIQAVLAPKLLDQTSIDWLLIDRLHPPLPSSANPLAFEVVERSGLYFKRIEGDTEDTMGINFRPAPGELAASRAYRTLKSSSTNRRENARQACYAFAGLAFALVGASAGRYLALTDRRPPAVE